MKCGLTVYTLLAILVASSAVLADDTPAAASEEGMAGNTQFLVGQTYLHDFWQPLNEPTSFGVEVDFAPKKSPVHVALALHVFGETKHVSTSYFGRTGKVGDGFGEFSAGFLWMPLKHAVVRPYLGAGVLTMWAAVGDDSDFWTNGDSDQSFGFYGNTGVFFKVGNIFNIGIDGRLVRGTSITLAGRDGNADYGQVNLLLGFAWGH